MAEIPGVPTKAGSPIMFIEEPINNKVLIEDPVEPEEIGETGINTDAMFGIEFPGLQLQRRLPDQRPLLEPVPIRQGLEPGQRIALEGTNKTVTAHDLMTFTSTPSGGTEVRYVAEFDFGLLTPVLSLLMWPFFKKLGDEAEKGMAEALTRL